MTAGRHPEDAAFVEVVRTLTQVARRRNNLGEPCDFADVLAGALAATAANIGGPDELLAGRPGSWEASFLGSLLEGTMGYQPQDWLTFRTQPVVVPLNVAELIERGDRHPGLLGLYDAIAAVEVRYESTEDERELEACGMEVAAVAVRYADAYRGYGERFTRAVQAVAADMGLRVDATAMVDDRPESNWWAEPAVSNPVPYDGDELVFQLWSEAHAAVSLPNVDVRVGDQSQAS